MVGLRDVRRNAGELLMAGSRAPELLVGWVVQREGPRVAADVANMRPAGHHQGVEDLVQQIIDSQVRLARAQGALAGFAVMAGEGTAIPGGPVGGMSATALALTGDLATLGWTNAPHAHGCSRLRARPGRTRSRS